MRRYLATALLARLADDGMGIAAALLALDRTGSAAVGGLVIAAWMAPHVLAAPLVGAWAGRVRRPRWCYAGALATFGAAIALLGAMVGRAPWWAVVACAVVGGSCGPVVSGGLSSHLGSLVPAGRRARAYGLDAASYNIAGICAPASVAALTTAGSAALATGALAFSAGAAALLALSLPAGHRPARADGAPPPPLRGELVSGARALWRVPELRAITAASSVAICGFAGLTLTSVLLAGRLGAPERSGLLMMALASGALTASLLVARWPPRCSPVALARWSLLGAGAPLLVAAWVDSFALVVVLFALAGAGDGPLLSAVLRVRDRYAPPAVRAQVFTLGAGMKVSAAAAGAALTSVAADHLSPAALLTVIAGVQFLAMGALPRSRPAAPTEVG